MTTDDKTLVERLERYGGRKTQKERRSGLGRSKPSHRALAREAKDRIEELEAENGRLRAALDWLEKEGVVAPPKEG